MDLLEIGKWVLAAIAALAAAGVVIKIVLVRKSSTTKSERTVIQKNNKAGRDIIGGDSIDNSTR